MATQGGPAQPISPITSGTAQGGPIVPAALSTGSVSAEAAQPALLVQPWEIGASAVAGGPAVPVAFVTGRAIQGGAARRYALTNSESALLLASSPGNLLAYWPYSEQSGTIAFDRSGNGRNGAYRAAGEPLLGQAGIGDGLTAPLFDGANDYVNLLTSGLANAFNGAEGSVATYARFVDDALRYAFFLQADASNQVFIRKQVTANQVVCVHNGGGTGKTAVLTLAPNTLYSIVWTWSATLGQARVWVNGQPGPDPAAGLGTFAGTPAVIVGGASTTTGTSPWKGLLAHQAVWNIAHGVGNVAQIAQKAGFVIFDGDSRTKGTTSPYPTQMMALPSMTAKNYAWDNYGVSGQTCADMGTDLAAQVLSQYRSLLGRCLYIHWAGVNDAAAGASVDTIYTRTADNCARARAAGFRTIVCTEIDAQDASRNAVNWHSTLQPALRTRVLNGYTAFADDVADLGGDSRLADANDATYFNADKVHLTDTGYGIVAALVAAKASTQ